ncbi:MAG TPA: CPBP family intramembrane glutamic endopeptidase [Thermodesulfobacteriota bacterium]|nr:CPBP family intramembrane glutamic endopeptidase [Thermodesulfobacteriota bacterium]
MTNRGRLKHADLIVAYVIVIGLITLMRIFLSSDFVVPLAAVVMFGAPFIMGSDVRGLRWDTRGVVLGIVVSAVILSIYVLIVDKPFRFGKISYSLIVLQLFFIALPEEVFFRGYLQEKIGNNIKGVIIASALFAFGHLVARCAGGGFNGSTCIQDILTFFPSIVMGFLYAVSGTLWGNIAFHFLANVIYEATGGL